ncbi:hypothetical protein EBZ80_10380 [bacterium]|nr:hypothetical protein [bacterium]
MLAREAMEMLGSVDRMEATAFQKKTVILRVCAGYDARLHDLRENVAVLTVFLTHYMRYRLVFHKKETVVDEFVDRFHAFVKMMPAAETPALLRLRVLLAVFSASYAQIRAVHERLVAYLGSVGDEDDDIRETVRVLRANGFYHYPYTLSAGLER